MQNTNFSQFVDISLFLFFKKKLSLDVAQIIWEYCGFYKKDRMKSFSELTLETINKNGWRFSTFSNSWVDYDCKNCGKVYAQIKYQNLANTHKNLICSCAQANYRNIVVAYNDKNVIFSGWTHRRISKFSFKKNVEKVKDNVYIPDCY